MKRALIAMSGGVDSSVAAFLMKEQGYDCIGVTMKLYDNEEIFIDSEKTCCSAEDIEDARAVAQKLGMPYYVLTLKEDFKAKVIDYFVRTYEEGGTPNPCIECNRWLKFERLLRKSDELGCDKIVTGHYAVIDEKDGRYYLRKGKDLSKDQSYVLYSLTQEQLSRIAFPLGAYTKDEIRTIAKAQGYINAQKHESQDICFVPDGDYARFIENYTHRRYEEGNFVDINGNVLGRHRGIIRYTVGQRKGLGIALGAPAYVVGKNIEENTVTLGSNEDLFSDTLQAERFNWIIEKPARDFRCLAKTRYNMKEQPCSVNTDGDRVTVRFDTPQRAITKGQAVVLYDGDTVLGGGTIL